MTRRVRTVETDHPYALQTWECRYPQMIPGDGQNDVLRVNAPKSYWLSLESHFPDYQNESGFATLDVLKRDLHGTNGCPALGDSFKTRVKKTIGALRKTFHNTDWQEKALFKSELMWISIKRHDFVSDTPNESPSAITPPPKFGPKPPPSAMFDHFPRYDEIVDSRQPADELQWDALFGIPQIGSSMIIAASNSTEEVSTTSETEENGCGETDYGDITAGITL